MDPTQFPKETWIDQVTIPGTTDKGFARRVLHADGRVVLTFYRYGENQVVTEQETTDSTQKKAWEDAQKAGQVQADQAERKVTRVYRGTDPATGRPAEVTEYQSGPPSYKELSPDAQKANVSGVSYHEDNGKTYKTTRYTDGTQTTEELPPGQAKPPTVVSSRSVKDENTGQSVTIETLSDGTQRRAESTVIPKSDKPQTVNAGNGEIGQIMPDGTYRVVRPANPEAPKPQELVSRDGKTFRIVRDAQGNVVREEEVPRTELTTGTIPESATGWTPDMNHPDNAYGLSERFREYARRMALPPTDPDYLSRDAAKQLYEQDKAVAEVVIGRNREIMSAQGSIYGNQVGQRNVDVQTANTRLSAARGAFDTSLGAVLRLNADLPKGSTAGARGLLALLSAQRAEANRYGGLKDIPREPLPPGLAAVYGMDPYGIAGLQPRPGAPTFDRQQAGALEQVATHQAPPAGAPAPSTDRYTELLNRYNVYPQPTAPAPGMVDPAQIAALQPPPPLDPAVVFGNVLASAEEEFRQLMGVA